jgi:regulator of replication initiation timing
MSTVEEIEKAIETLPRDQFYQLREWVQSRFEDEWDRQIEEDSLSGRLDHLVQEALTEHRAGLTTPFPPDEKQGDA